MKNKNINSSSSSLLNKQKFSAWPYIFLLPVLVSLAVFTFYPFIKSFYLTLFVTDRLGKAAKFVGLSNFQRVFKNKALVESVVDTIKYAGAICIGTFSLALILSFLCVNPCKGSRVYQTMFSMPLAIATAPIAAIGTYIFGKYGMLNDILGTSIIWLGDDRTKFWALIFLVCWCNCGSSFIYLLVGFRNVPDELVECADLDGASPLRKLFSVYLPIASPQVFYVVFLNILTAFKSFTMIKILFGTNETGLKVLNSQIYEQAFVQNRFETACIFAIALCVLIFLTTRIQFILEKKMVHYQ